jgi:hypothetical protein
MRRSWLRGVRAADRAIALIDRAVPGAPQDCDWWADWGGPDATVLAVAQTRCSDEKGRERWNFGI